jgi:predicted anti-sigma-YlaC factor YlaD
MTQSAHERVRELIALAGANRGNANLGDANDRSNDGGNGKDPSSEQLKWLQAHLAECSACRDYADATGRVVRALRFEPLAADSALVQTTRMRVRERALELQRQHERLWVICVCCVAVTLVTASTTAALWRGFAWLGQQAQLPGPAWQMAWQIGVVALGFMPAMVAGILMLARGTYWADHNGSGAD